MEVDFTKALAGVTALAAALTGLAAATGAFDQMQRNEPQWSAAIFSAAVLAGVLVVAAGFTKDTVETVLGGLALIAFIFAAVAGIVFLIQARGDRPPPSIKVAFKTEPALSVSGVVKAEQMSSKETLKVRVLADEPSGNGDPDGIGKEHRLYDARLGADASGEIDLPLEVPIPTKKYRWLDVLAWIDEVPEGCFTSQRPRNFKKTPGCVVMRLPDSGAAP